MDDCVKRQTSTATPAEPGGLPYGAKLDQAGGTTRGRPDHQRLVQISTFDWPGFLQAPGRRSLQPGRITPGGARIGAARKSAAWCHMSRHAAPANPSALAF